MEGCPVSYEVSKIEDDGSERALTVLEENVLFHNTYDGRLIISTDDFNLDTAVWNIRLYMRATYSEMPGRDGSYVF